MTAIALPSEGINRAHEQLMALKARLRESIRQAKRAHKTIKPRKRQRGATGEEGAGILGGILGAQVYLDYGGSSQIDADNPFNPTGVTPVGANPAGKP
jgi:hypothetical protein